MLSQTLLQGVVLSSPDEMPRVYIVTMCPVKFRLSLLACDYLAAVWRWRHAAAAM